MKSFNHSSANATLLTILFTVLLPAVHAEEVVIQAMDFSGKDSVWVNRFEPDIIALKGNHQIISGDIWWNHFPGSSGTYAIQMEKVTSKKYGENPYRFYIDNSVVKSGKIHRCNPCLEAGGIKNTIILKIGTHQVNNGDQIKFWAESDYDVLSGPGAYASFARIRFTKEGGGNPPQNHPPSVSITSPSNNVSFTEPANISISTTASDSDGSVTKVAFYNGNSKLGEDTSSPYNFSWNNVAAGNYKLTAIATDNDGATKTSSEINIIVDPQPDQELKITVNGSVTTLTGISSYGNQDISGVASIKNNDTVIEITGNGWKKMPLNYTLTKDTILEFDFAAPQEGEIHAIGFDADNTWNGDDRLFQLHGTQTPNDMNRTFHDYNGGTKNYLIPVGEHFTGNMNFLTFANDDDADASGVSQFSNIKIYESIADPDSTPPNLITNKVSVNGTVPNHNNSAKLFLDGQEVSVNSNGSFSIEINLSNSTSQVTLRLEKDGVVSQSILKVQRN